MRHTLDGLFTAQWPARGLRRAARAAKKWWSPREFTWAQVCWGGEGAMGVIKRRACRPQCPRCRAWVQHGTQGA